MENTVKYSASQKAIEYLKTNLANATWRVGEKIPSENELTRKLGVSRASIRQAIQQFIALGMVESFRGKGTFIVSNAPNAAPGGFGAITEKECRDLEKILEFRAILEPRAALLAAQRANKTALATLCEHLNKLVASIGDSEEFVRYDMLFHLEICRASQNPLLEKSLREIFNVTVQDHKKINKVFGYKDGVYYHSLILKAFRKRDPKLVRDLMAEHLEQALKQLRG